MIYAATCTCEYPLDFEPDSCTRCGRFLPGAIGDFTDLPDGLIRLEIAVEQMRIEIRAEAEAEGIETDAEYLAWLEAREAARDDMAQAVTV